MRAKLVTTAKLTHTCCFFFGLRPHSGFKSLATKLVTMTQTCETHDGWPCDWPPLQLLHGLHTPVQLRGSKLITVPYLCRSVIVTTEKLKLTKSNIQTQWPRPQILLLHQQSPLVYASVNSPLTSSKLQLQLTVLVTAIDVNGYLVMADNAHIISKLNKIVCNNLCAHFQPLVKKSTI